MISRTIAGLSKGNVSLSTAIVTDVSNEERRGKGMALIGMAFSLGFILGPVMGASFSVYSKSLSNWTTSSSSAFFILPAAVSLTLSLINVFFVTFFFHESLPIENRVSFSFSSLRLSIHWLKFLSFVWIKVSSLSRQSHLERDWDKHLNTLIRRHSFPFAQLLEPVKKVRRKAKIEEEKEWIM